MLSKKLLGGSSFLGRWIKIFIYTRPPPLLYVSSPSAKTIKQGAIAWSKAKNKNQCRRWYTRFSAGKATLKGWWAGLDNQPKTHPPNNITHKYINFISRGNNTHAAHPLPLPLVSLQPTLTHVLIGAKAVGPFVEKNLNHLSILTKMTLWIRIVMLCWTKVWHRLNALRYAGVAQWQSVGFPSR